MWQRWYTVSVMFAGRFDPIDTASSCLPVRDVVPARECCVLVVHRHAIDPQNTS